MDEESRPDRLEKMIRLGCGAVAGLLLGLALGFVSLQLTEAPLWFFASILGTVFALLALHYGDKFWLGVLNALRGPWI